MSRSDECSDSPDGMNSSDDFRMENIDDESDLELLLSDIESFIWLLLLRKIIACRSEGKPKLTVLRITELGNYYYNSINFDACLV